MKIVSRIALLLVLLTGGLGLLVRLAPTDPADWHVDPLSAPRPDGNGWLVRPEGGNAAAEPVDLTPEALLARLDAIAMDWPRTERLAGSVAEGRITYVTRSRLWGFPDYTTVTALPSGAGAVPVLFARQRFGRGDWGVNRARVEAWLAALHGDLAPR